MRFGCSAVLLALILPLQALAQDTYAAFGGGSAFGTALLPAPSDTLRYAPRDLRGGTKLTVVAPLEWAPLSEIVSDLVHDTLLEYFALIGAIPAFDCTLKLLEEEEFFAETGAPRWTNAMFYRGEILIPISLKAPIDGSNMYRSIRHEFTHAVLHAISGGFAPGWLDEGLAQWREGSVNPALGPALRRWVSSRPPVPLALLQGGFTKLEDSMVPAAYAQSLFAANSLLDSEGFRRIGRYLNRLRTTNGAAGAFHDIFGFDEAQFERQLGDDMRHWAATRTPLTLHPEQRLPHGTHSNAASISYKKGEG